jgi:transglycosylase-like protein with SLT domain/uncharacterized protein DUF4124
MAGCVSQRAVHRLAPGKLLTLKYIFVISALALCFASMPRHAQAQIYSWKDANGVMVLSNRPKDPGSAQRTFGPSQPATTGVMAPVVMSGSSVMSGSNAGAKNAATALGSRYEPLIREHADQRGIRPELVRAVIQVESAFNPRAVSPKGAMGLMQLMPATAALFGVLDPFNPVENIRAGVRYLRLLLDRYNDNEQLALAAYNAGPATVEKYGNRIPPYRETQNYVRKVTNIKGTTRSAPGVSIYKVTEIVDGQPTVRYTNTKPTSGTFEQLSNRR